MLGYIWSLDCIGMDIYILIQTSCIEPPATKSGNMSTHKRTQLLRSIQICKSPMHVHTRLTRKQKRKKKKEKKATMQGI